MECAGLMGREDTKPVTKYKKPKGNEGKWQRKGNMAVLPTVKKLPDWNNHSSVFAARCQCVSAWDPKPSVRVNLLPHLLSFFLPIISTPVWFVTCPGQATGSHPSSPSCPTLLPIPVILQQIPMQNSDLLLPKTGSRALSLQHFLRTKFYGLKHKHSQVPCQFSHSSLHYS